MRLFLSLLAYAALTAAVLAQPPTEVRVSDTIRMSPGEIRVFTFDRAVGRLDVPSDIVQIVPESDRTYSFRAVKPGATVITAFDPGQNMIHRENLVVSGGYVKIYGNDKDEEFVLYVCTEFGCGRAPGGVERPTTGESVAVTTRDRRGNIITTTKSYEGTQRR